MPGHREVGRLGAALVASSVVLHLLMLHHLAVGPAVLMVVLAAACVPCGVALWRGGSTRAWGSAGAMAVLMLVVHRSGDMHQMPGHGSALGVLATWVASAETLLAVAVVLADRAARHRSGQRAT